MSFMIWAFTDEERTSGEKSKLRSSLYSFLLFFHPSFPSVPLMAKLFLGQAAGEAKKTSKEGGRELMLLSNYHILGILLTLLYSYKTSQNFLEPKFPP